MNQPRFVDYESRVQRYKRRKLLKKIVSVLCCVVVFCTTYALILPAITMEGEVFCGMEAHTHSEECYKQVRLQQLICTPESLIIHSHSSDCYDSSGLICGRADYIAHTHDASCYDQNDHLICLLPERDVHVHQETCYAPAGTETPVLHNHSDACYLREKGDLLCAITEDQGHTHDDACFAVSETLICGLEEGQPEPVESILICREPVAQMHVHDDSCFQETEAKYVMICTDLSAAHKHTALCYELVCGKTEHTHSTSCYSNPTADVESAAVWKNTFANVELTGNWPEDVLAIAQSQLGYTESSRNYDVWEDESLHGYTRYGDWYGLPYSDWCAMFVSFCLNYAEVDDIPLHCDVRPWIQILTEKKLYHTPENYMPKPGDLVFFDWEGDGAADHLGFVAEIIPETEYEHAKLKTLEGNSDNRVQYVYYNLDDSVLCGYSELPENKDLYGCGFAGHSHNEYCHGADGELNCDIPVHIHEDTCLVNSDETPTEPTAPAENVTEPPASTEPFSCAKEEHIHSENCFDPEGQLICALEEHTHDDACLTDIPEDPAEEPTEPTSEPDAIYVCETEAHAHDEACFDPEGQLICTLEEHTHDDACLMDIPEDPAEEPTEPALDSDVIYICETEEHIHDEFCYDVSGNLICILTEHTHNETCVELKYICGTHAHTHNESCYDTEGTMVCEQNAHEHNAACEGYTCGMITHIHGSACYNEAGTLICRTLPHEHSSICSHYICGKTVHIHGHWCYDAADRPVCGQEAHSHSADCISYTLTYRDLGLRVTATITGVEMLPDNTELLVVPVTQENAPDQFISMESAVNDELANSNQYAGALSFYDLRLRVDGVDYSLPHTATVDVTIDFISPVFNEEDVQNSAGCQTFVLTTEKPAHEEMQNPGFLDTVVNTIGDFVSDLFPNTAVTGAETDREVDDQGDTYQASPITGEDNGSSEAGITTVAFQTNQLAAFGVILTADESTDPVVTTYWQRVNSKQDIKAGANYMIISADGNYALSAGSSNYHPVQIHAVKGNVNYFTISNDVNTDLIWTIEVSNNNYTIRNGRRYLVPGSNTVVTTSSNTVSLSTGTYSTAGGPFWYFTKSNNSGRTTYKLYNDGGQFKSSTSVSNETRNMLIFKQVDVGLYIPSDPKGTPGGGNTPDGSVPDPNLYLPFMDPGEIKIGVDGTAVTNGDVTVIGSYYSDAPTSDIEQQFRILPNPADDTAEAKLAAALAAFQAHQKNDGKVLTDKSVIYGDDAYGAFDSYAPNTFGVTLSTLAQAYQQFKEEIVPIPVDVVYILDVSGSMQDNNRAVNLVEAVNKSMKQIMDAHEANRVGIALYSSGSMQLLPLDRYTANNDIYIQVERSGGSVTGGILTTASLRNSAGSKAYANKGENGFDGLGTFTQAGIASGYQIFQAIPQGVVDNTGTQYTATMPSGRTFTVTRQPVLVLVSDGEPTHCTNIYNDPLNGPFYGDGTSAVENYTQNGYSYTRNALGIMGYYTVLTANYYKSMTSIHYDTPALFYTIGMGIAESGKGNRASAHAEYDGYKRAVLNPAVIYDADTAKSVAFSSVTLNLMQNLLGETFNGSQINQKTSDYITVNRNNNVCGTWVNDLNADVPVLKSNPYKNNFCYTDEAFFGEMDSAKLKEVFDTILQHSTKTNPYSFILYESISSVYFTDNIGEGMEIKGLENNPDGSVNALAPVLQYGNTQYKPKSVVTNGNVTTISYDGIYDDPLIPDRTIDLTEIEVTITTNSDGTQTLRFVVPDTALPVYIPDDSGSFYYEALPARLIYQVGLTAASEQAILELNNTGGTLTFYTNSWGNGDDATSILLPHISNPYYFEFIEGENGEIISRVRTDINHHEYKVENVTGTHSQAVDCTILQYADTVTNTHILGNNGKLVFTAETVEIPVTKVWAPGTPENAKIPVEITLYKVTPPGEGEDSATGQVVGTVAITADDQWIHTFTDLPKPNGSWYYAIAETVTEGFEATYTGGELVSFTVTDEVGRTEILAVKINVTQGETGITVDPITVTNEYRMYELPETGGIGTNTIYTLGILLILLWGVYLVYDNKMHPTSTPKQKYPEKERKEIL